MIKAIDELSCTNCGLCVDVCQLDVFRLSQGKVNIAYPGDCCNCMDCVYLCPYDAIIVVPGVPKMLDPAFRWRRIKDVLNAK